MGVEEYQSRWAYARCAGLTKEESDAVFFVSSGRPRKVPLYEKFCGACPIVNFCLSYAIIYEEEGTWGGMTKTQRDQLGRDDEERETIRQALIAEAKHQGWYVERLPVEKLIQIAMRRQEVREIEVLIEVPEFDLFELAEFDLFAGPQQFYSQPEYTEQIQSKPDTPEVQLQVAALHQDSDNGQYVDSSVSLFGFPSALPDSYQNSMQLLGN